MSWDGVKRRRYVRVPIPYTTNIDTPYRNTISTYTENISEGGIKITIKEKLSIFSMNSLKIYIKEEPIICKGKVIWITEKESQYSENIIFETGVEFHEIKYDDRLIIKNIIKELEKNERMIIRRYQINNN